MRAVGYRRSLPIDQAEALLDIEIEKPAPPGRDLLVQVKRSRSTRSTTRCACAAPEGRAPRGCWAGTRPAPWRRRPGRDAVQGRRRGLLRRQHRPPRRQQRVPPGRRAHRRPKPPPSTSPQRRRPAADLDHRLGSAVRAPRHRPRRRRGQSAADHRRRRRRRLDRDPAREQAGRAHSDRHRLAPGVAEWCRSWAPTM